MEKPKQTSKSNITMSNDSQNSKLKLCSYPNSDIFSCLVIDLTSVLILLTHIRFWGPEQGFLYLFLGGPKKKFCCVDGIC